MNIYKAHNKKNTILVILYSDERRVSQKYNSQQPIVL